MTKNEGKLCFCVLAFRNTLISKKQQLHVQHTSLLLFCTTKAWNFQITRFMNREQREQRERFTFLSSVVLSKFPVKSSLQMQKN